LRTGLIAGRFQIAIHLLNDYTRLLQLDKKISGMDCYRAWPVEGVPVQNVVRVEYSK
jgi:hypothetical protein